MSTKEGLYTDGSSAYAAKVNSIPLSDVDSAKGAENTIGDLVSNATSQMSTLFRSEVELAKTEIMGEVKKGAIGGGFFAGAGVIGLYSSFFLFFFLAELLAIWLERWAAFLIVFLIMLVLAAVLALIGFQRVRKIRKPEATIKSVTELKKLKPGSAEAAVTGADRGLYT